MQALHDIGKEGYVRYIGMSSCHAYQCELTICTRYHARTLTLIRSFSPSDAKCVCRRATLNHRAHDVADYAITHNLTPFISMQNHYSMIYREEEREMFPTLKVCPSYLAQKLRTAP